jgi:phosphoribosylformimino-5-aminoimidazole carboxamide ribotide isomerase
VSRPLLFPSIDLLAGRVVRLRQGDYAQTTTYDIDAVDVALAYCDGGAEWVHVVDLDAAKTGERVNRDIVAAVATAVSGRAALQVGGGVRSLADATALADAGVSRVVMGSAALADPALVDVVAARVPVAVGLDHRRGVLAVHGWTESSGVALVDALDRFPAASAFVITDIDRDGLLGGPDVDGLAAAAAATGTPVIASGGVSSLDDIRRLASIPRLGGIIAGRSLYEGRFTVTEAVAAIDEVVDPRKAASE